MAFGNKIMKRLQHIYVTYAYTKKTGNILNHITLKISDPEIEKKLRTLKSQQFNKIVLIALFFNVITLISNTYSYISERGPQFMCLMSIASFINQLIMVACKYCCPLYSARTIYGYVLIQCVFTVCFYYDVFGEFELYKDKYSI